MVCVRALTDRQAKLKAVKLQRKVDKMKAGAEKLIELANRLPDDAHKREVEKLIDDSNRQADALKELAEEAEDVEMVDLATDWKEKLVFTAQKLKQQFPQNSWTKESREASERPKPIFVKKESSFRASDHWYSRQSPSTGNWAEDVEEEWPTGSFREQPVAGPGVAGGGGRRVLHQGRLQGPLPASPGQVGQPDGQTCEASPTSLASLHG